MLSTPSPTSFIIFGASGHLARLKLFPALFTLATKKRLSTQYAVIGFARTAMHDGSFRSFVEQAIRENAPDAGAKEMQEFLAHCHYQQGGYDATQDFVTLRKKLESFEQGWGGVVRLAYLSVPPQSFPPIAKNLRSGGIAKSGMTFRCIVEKPVGRNLQSFEETEENFTANFAEDEVYLLDHYLGKEAVRNIYYLRYANPVLERILKNTIIDHVQIAASETVGLEGRSGYFENTGTFRDMFQSHLLQICALLTMRLADLNDIAAGRRTALEQFYLPPASDLSDLVLQGQYTKGTIEGNEVPGYTEEEGIPRTSRTNTFATLKLMTRISRWEGIPFYLRSGKRLGKKETRISIAFQEPRAIGPGATRNRLDIILQGEAGMRLHLQTKLGGVDPAFRPLVLEDPLICYGDCLPEHGLLLLEATHGKRAWFLSFEEVRTAWHLLDPLLVYLEHPETPLYLYSAGSNGPKEVDAWIGKDTIQWL